MLWIATEVVRCNTARVASGLPPLDPDTTVRAAAREWKRLLEEARARLRERAGRELANNSLTHMILSREIEPAFLAYLASFTAAAAPEQDSGGT